MKYLWGYWKHHELPNFCPRDFGQLSYQARAPRIAALAPGEIVLVAGESSDDLGYASQ